MPKPIVALCRAAVTLLISWLAAAPAGAADPVTIQGSTTFSSLLIEPHRAAIESLAGRRIEVIANKSIHGLVALLEGRARMAMISSALTAELEPLQRKHPSLPVDRLVGFEVASTRVAVITHPAIPMRQIRRNDLARVLLGETKNWRQLGGPDLAITVVTVQPGGGVPTTVRSQVLGGKPIAAPLMVEVEAPRHVPKITRQLEGALGLTQLGLARQTAASELQLDERIEQELNLVTLGEPDRDLAAVIEAVRKVAAQHLH